MSADTPTPPRLTVVAIGSRFDAAHDVLSAAGGPSLPDLAALSDTPCADAPDMLLGVASAESFTPPSQRPAFGSAVVSTRDGMRLETYPTLLSRVPRIAPAVAHFTAMLNIQPTWPSRLGPLVRRFHPDQDVHLVVGHDWGLILPDDADWVLGEALDGTTDLTQALSRHAMGWITGAPDSNHDRRAAQRRANRVAQAFAALSTEVNWTAHGGLTANLVDFDALRA